MCILYAFPCLKYIKKLKVSPYKSQIPLTYKECCLVGIHVWIT